MNRNEAQAAFRAHRARFEREGVILSPSTVSYIPDEVRGDFDLAMDAMPTLVSTPDGGIPAFLTTLIDPAIFKILLAPNRAAEIFGEARKGSWTDQTALFPTLERTGEVSSYGDFSENGRAGINPMWPQRQSYLYQIIKEYGELELARAGVARISWAAELDEAVATLLKKFENLTYFFGVTGLQNYGLLNDPSLGASLTPAAKSAGGVKWINNGVINATANEIYADIQAIYLQLVTQSGGLVDQDTKFTLAMSPGSEVALTATNSFNVNVSDLLKKNFRRLEVKTAVQYALPTTANNQGNAAGNLVQLIADSLEGQDTGYCAFNERMRNHPVIRQLSSFKQKTTAGTWGSIVRMPVAIASMVGV